MPRRPAKGVMDAAKVKLDPVGVLQATINAMKDPELEKRLVDAGVARYVDAEGGSEQ